MILYEVLSCSVSKVLGCNVVHVCIIATLLLSQKCVKSWSIQCPSGTTEIRGMLVVPVFTSCTGEGKVQQPAVEVHACMYCGCVANSHGEPVQFSTC